MERQPMLRVVRPDGTSGTLVVCGEKTSDGRRQMEARFDDGTAALIPANALILQDDGSYHVAQFAGEAETGGAVAQLVDETAGTIVLPVVEERLAVETRRRTTGGVRVRKIVRQREAVIDEPLRQEHVDVERVAINRLVAADETIATRQEGDILIVPVFEEVVVLEKRLLLKEELRISKRSVTVSDPKRVTLRREEVELEPIDPESAGAADQAGRPA